MPFYEKSAWSTVLIAVVIGVLYVMTLAGRATDATHAADIAYTWPMVTAIVGWVIATIIVNVALAASAPADAMEYDERDREIARFADRIGYYGLSFAVLAAIALAMLEYSQFWIAQLLFGALAVTTLLSALVTVFAYRRGVPRW
jgi:hypothetical protein